MQLGLTHLVLVFFFFLLLLLFSSFRFSHKQWAVTDVQIEVKEVVNVEEREKKKTDCPVCVSRDSTGSLTSGHIQRSEEHTSELQSLV